MTQNRSSCCLALKQMKGKCGTVIYIPTMGGIGGVVVSTATSQQDGCGSKSTGWPEPFCMEYPPSPMSVCSDFLRQSKDTHVRLIDVSKLPVGENVSVKGCLSQLALS